MAALYENLVEELSKPEARALLKQFWAEYMKTYVRPPAPKRGGKRVPLAGHGAKQSAAKGGAAAGAANVD